MCYSVDSQSSFEHVPTWKTEISHYAPNAKIMLVGTKSDHETELKMQKESIARIPKETITEMQQTIGAFDHMECSAKELRNVNEVFGKTIDACLEKQKPKGKKCSLM